MRLRPDPFTLVLLAAIAAAPAISGVPETKVDRDHGREKDPR